MSQASTARPPIRSVLCYGDSNTHGLIRTTPHQRFGPSERWPGVMRDQLGEGWVVYEEGLCGRTTMHDDPVEGAFRNGRLCLKPCLETHKPLDIIILMLGTNDMKKVFNKSALEIGDGINVLIEDIKQFGKENNLSRLKIILVSPPFIQEKLGDYADKFDQAYEKSLNLSDAYKDIARKHNIDFVNASLVANTNGTDGIHMNLASHKSLGEHLAEKLTLKFSELKR